MLVHELIAQLTTLSPFLPVIVLDREHLTISAPETVATEDIPVWEAGGYVELVNMCELRCGAPPFRIPLLDDGDEEDW
jgi:hypothetical protein